MNYNYSKDLDRLVPYVKELYFREVAIANGDKQTALEQMLGYGYCDQDLRFLCNSMYINHSAYMQAFRSFADNP